MPADLAILSARVRTLDPAKPSAQAVAVENGAIVAVGSDAEIRELCGAATELIDAGGRALTPGLVDSHQHTIAGVPETVGLYLNDVKRLDDLRRVIAEERRRLPDGAWIRGYSLNYSVFTETGVDGRLLDEAAGGNPVCLIFFDFHTGLVNSRALELAGIDGPRQFEENAEVVVRDGRPTGELREEAAIRLIEPHLPELTEPELHRMYGESFRAKNALGMTGAHVMDGRLDSLDLYDRLEADGSLTLRLVSHITISPDTPRAAYDDVVAVRDRRGGLWSGGCAKFFIDGVIEPGTAWLFEPDAAGLGLAPFWPEPERYTEAVRFFAAAGFGTTTHAIGDRGVAWAIDAKAGARRNARPHRIEHLETMRDEDLPRIAAAGIVPCQQSYHQQWMNAAGTDPWSTALGPERTARGFRSRDLLDACGVLALGSDWPVAHYDPRLGLAWARLRRPPGEPSTAPQQPGQVLTALEALEGYTVHAAAAAGDQALYGRLRVGMRADLALFSVDPVECPADDLPSLECALTAVDGRIVHRTGV